MTKKVGRPRKQGRPRKTTTAKRRQTGGNVFRNINNFLRRTRAISRIANAVGGPIGSSVGTIANHFGYGSQSGGRTLGTIRHV